ncbi:MAG: glycoside hydrolase family 88 protein [Bacteroides sp.]|nr:glycoside hydrolase family 88 protein [Roseburia sp.]MCM1346599.1 glycoside hydrolase family 88 protein [Bacteroides sp.]MCM1420499.1 glycoside hydrolase family 88 protein [Bacteroides sp.]
MIKQKSALCLLLCLAGGVMSAQNQPQEPANDANSPLHLMRPAYKTHYGVPTPEEVKSVMDRVCSYLEQTTFMQVENKETHQPVKDLHKINSESQLVRGTFRLTSYEWGVTYSAMLRAAEVTGDKRYYRYAVNRMRYLAELAPYFRKILDKGEEIDVLMHQVVKPEALDDAGAICAAMIKAKMQDKTLPLDKQIDTYYQFISKEQYRLADGIFGRLRPLKNTVWLDDMFMGIPALAWKAAASNDMEGMTAAAEQFQMFHSRMWVEEKQLYRHGWAEGMEPHPSFFWGRANGWALLTACELMDALPESHSAYDIIKNQFKQHLQGIVSLQGHDGAWHQLLDRNDTYLETSCTAIYAYCIAHAINKGWIDAQAYGAAALLAWNYVESMINKEGQVCGTCVGTGMAFDPAFYAYRPVNNFAAHGYGPVIWAGAEIIEMVRSRCVKLNDSAIHFYPQDPETDEPIFYVKP